MSRNRAAVIATNVLLNAALLYHRKSKRRPRRWWIKPWMNTGYGNLSLPEEFCSANDSRCFRNYLRMDEKTFHLLLSKIKHRIEKQDTHLRQCIPAEDKLIITIRYLATGESFRSLMFNYRVSETAISLFVRDICLAIYDELKKEYLKVSSTRITFCTFIIKICTYLHLNLFYRYHRQKQNGLILQRNLKKYGIYQMLLEQWMANT